MSQSSQHTLLCTSISRFVPSATYLPLLSQSCIFTTCDSFQYHLPLLEQFVFLLFFKPSWSVSQLNHPITRLHWLFLPGRTSVLQFPSYTDLFPTPAPPTFLICQLQSLLPSYSHTSQAPTHIPTTRKTDQRRSKDLSLTTTAYLNTTKVPSKSHLSFSPPGSGATRTHTHTPSWHCARCPSSPKNRIYLNFSRQKKKKKASFLLQRCMPKFSCYKLLKKNHFQSSRENIPFRAITVCQSLTACSKA